MLQLKNITKTYGTSADGKVQALKGIDIEFRENEFVSILGPSGCGKTTLLNIIGGLDKYTTGDLVINGKSTKEFKDRDWDTYRNHSVGFVFQNYNLISHQSILSNVELALTLAGMGKQERRKKAIKALEEVGLKDQIHKRPNQLSGGQMQRVAIARALVSDPDILLADEPTGALDSSTSIQIMDLLKEIAKDRLVIMVTHNPELAEKYSTRIVKLLDGKIIDDSNPYVASTEEINEALKKKKSTKKTYMNYFTALSLSFNNLLTKKGRTFLTAFAGSIGIIGIALILSLSNGVHLYIEKVQEDTLSSYPILIQKSNVDMSAMIESFTDQVMPSEEENNDKNVVTSQDIIMDIMSDVSAGTQTNNLEGFKKYIESESDVIKSNSTAIKYTYDLDLNIYKEEDNNYIKVNPSEVFNNLDPEYAAMVNSMTSTYNVWEEMLDNEELLESQYDLLAGSWPKNYNEVVVIVDKNNRINDYALYSLGLKDINEFNEKYEKMVNGETVEKSETLTFTYEDLLNLKYKVLLNTDYYEKEGGMWVDKSDDENYINDKLNNAIELKVVGIIRPNEEASSTSLTGVMGYTHSLTEYVANEINKTQIAKEQLENKDINVFTGTKFTDNTNTKIDYNSLTMEQKQYLASLSDEQRAMVIAQYTSNSGATYEDNLKTLGIVNLDVPASISIYPRDFDAKNVISDEIDKYNQKMEDEQKEADKITYTDYIGIMLNAVTSIVDMISYVLIGFVGISLVVSSIMIGIITYISVLERTKEIGILRSIGASKKDISRVFNAETFIVGVFAGVIGIGVTILLNIPANMIIKALAGVSNISTLPVYGAIALIIISMLLTVIAGLVPSKMAAKKDPVESLRVD